MTTEMPEKTAVPRLAATIVLLREADGRLHALMLQRHSKLAFAAGDWAFPGGAVDAADRLLAQSLDFVRSGHGGIQEQALRVAACRETFEESGVLLARYSHGDAALLGSAEFAASPRPFAELLHDRGLQPCTDQIARWSNWITPSFAPRRFDTVFFIAAMPEGQDVVFNPGESQAAAWVPVDDLSGLTPSLGPGPASLTLQEIAQRYRSLGSLAALLASAHAGPPVSIMVKMYRGAAGYVGLLPWDADYPAAKGEGVACTPELLARFRDFPSRFIIDPATRMPAPPEA